MAGSITSKCIICRNSFTFSPSQKRKYCSKKCWNTRATLIKKCGECQKEFRTFLSINKKYCNVKCRNQNYTKRLGNNNSTWKGNNVGYDGLHLWVKRHRKKIGKCQSCGTYKITDWANKSHEYKRDLKDWIELCRSCHRYYDQKCDITAKEIFSRRNTASL